MRFSVRQGADLERAEVFLCQFVDFLRIDIADHYQRRVVGCVPLLVPVACILRRHVFQIIHPADDGAAIRVRLIDRSVELFVDLRMRLVVSAPAAFFHHHADLLGELFFGQHQIVHAVGFELDGKRQLRFLQLLEIRRVIAAGKGIFASAGSSDDARELARLDLLRTLEHHVFQHMGNAGLAVDFVDAAGAIPDLRHHHRRAVVFLDDDAHPVIQLEFMRIGERQCRQHGQQDDQTSKYHLVVLLDCNSRAV